MGHRRMRAPPRYLFRCRVPVLLLALFSTLFFLASLHICATVLRCANELGRRCMPSTSAYSDISSSATTRTPKIAMVSLSQEESGDGEGRPPQRRSFRGVMAAVGGNKREYAARMGYDFVDAHDLVDPSRPPSWSKILAVRSQLPSHDWVFWNDADTVVTNPDISLENILLGVIGKADFDTAPDLVVTKDVNGINAGVFFIRRSKWSENFLQTWWNQTSFVQFGSTKSGDNDALKYLIRNLSSDELRDHVQISPMQCLFNSYPWHPSWKSLYQLIFSSGAVWKGAYSKGDFMVHLAGLDDKKGWVARIIQELEAERKGYVYLARQRLIYTP